MSNYAFEQMRPLQVEVIDRIISAFEDHKYVMLEAPTGIGKSGIVMSVALAMGESYINTSSKLLQDQYLRDFDFIKTVKGKSNFECIDPDSDVRLKLTCEKGACQFDSKYLCQVKPKKEEFIVFNRGTKNQTIVGPATEKCKYFTQKMLGFKAGHTILNYSYFFSMFFYTDELGGRNLLVFDEAHNIENQILEFISLHPNPGQYDKFYKALVEPNDFLKANIKLPPYPANDKVETWIEYLKGTDKWMQETQRYYEDANLPPKIRGTLSDLETASKRVTHVVSIMEQDPSNWVIDIKYDFQKIKSVKISPIETGPYVKPVFDMGDKVLLTSATLLDKEVYANMIGVPSSEIAFIRINESPFPKENRPIILKNVGEMNFKTMEGMMPKIASEIDSILAEHPNERGIIHCTSYKQLEYIIRASVFRDRLIKTETGVAQTDALTRAASKANAVLISPSMHEGVDLKDDLSRFQITIKIPYMDLSDKRTMVKMRRSPNWYQWNAILKLIQGVGRSIRNDKDYAVTYVLDSKVGSILQNKMVPQYIKEAII